MDEYNSLWNKTWFDPIKINLIHGQRIIKIEKYCDSSIGNNWMKHFCVRPIPMAFRLLRVPIYFSLRLAINIYWKIFILYVHHVFCRNIKYFHHFNFQSWMLLLWTLWLSYECRTQTYSANLSLGIPIGIPLVNRVVDNIIFDVSTMKLLSKINQHYGYHETDEVAIPPLWHALICRLHHPDVNLSKEETYMLSPTKKRNLMEMQQQLGDRATR